MWIGAWRVASILLLYIYVGFCCYFSPFVRLSSFDPVNLKGTKKQSFSNISTEKGLILRRI
ncbi:hypothetical protein Hanom_Chr10g00915281 [Helianthus anomalus]